MPITIIPSFYVFVVIDLTPHARRSALAARDRSAPAPPMPPLMRPDRTLLQMGVKHGGMGGSAEHTQVK
jgi:hypothetical protein